MSRYLPLGSILTSSDCLINGIMRSYSLQFAIHTYLNIRKWLDYCKIESMLKRRFGKQNKSRYGGSS